MKNTNTYPKSFAELSSSIFPKPILTTMNIQSRLVHQNPPTLFNASSHLANIKHIKRPELTTFGFTSTVQKEMSSIKPLCNLHKELTSPLKRMNELNASYSKQLSSLTSMSTNWINHISKALKPLNSTLKYYEENKEEIDKTLELFEKYAKDYPVEAEEMSVVEFMDFVEFQENFAVVFKDIFSPVASYQVPTSYQLISDVYEKLDNQIEKYMSVEEKETIHKMFSIVVSFIFGKAVDDIPNFSEISTLAQLIIVVMFYPQIKKFLRH